MVLASMLGRIFQLLEIVESAALVNAVDRRNQPRRALRIALKC
jgi:hypothetical protein